MRNTLILSLVTGFISYGWACSGFADAQTISTQTPQTQAIANLLLGEIAINQNQLQTANEYYFKASNLSQDPQIAKRTLYLALTVDQKEMALNAAQQWATLAPRDAEAQLFNFQLLLQANQPTPALNYLQKALALQEKEVLNTVINQLPQTSPANQQALLNAIDKLDTKQQKAPALQVITALLQFQAGAPTQAIDLISKALLQRPAWPQAIALKADFMIHNDQVNEALSFVNAKADAYPKIMMIQLIDAQLLLKTNQVAAATTKLKSLTKNTDTRGIALLSLAQIAIQQKQFSTAQQYLKDATSDPIQAANAYYLLGEIYQFEQKTELAIKAYQQVNSGENYINAQIKAAQLLNALGNTDAALDNLSAIKVDNMKEARPIILLQVELLLKLHKETTALNVLNKALSIAPKDTELLYAHSLVAFRVGDKAQSEKDLKQILVISPNQLNALNALAYLLIQTPSRYQEALNYTQQALKIAPKDAAVLDTMGWLQFHMGNLNAASKYLDQAYQLDDDALIAAHYGEVLWSMGDKPAAQKIWQNSLKKFPDNSDLLATIKRLTGKG